MNAREKGRDLTQSFDKIPYTYRTKSNMQHDNTKNATRNVELQEKN